VREAARLTADALAAAERTIYIEAQYLTAPFVADLLAGLLGERDGPEIVVVTTLESHGFAERLVMGANRDRMIRRLRKADRQGRLRVFYPVVPNGAKGECQVLIHSKLIIVDDIFLRVGSSNLNNRSIGVDTECDLAVEAKVPKTRAAIARLRDQLVGEHLGVSGDEVRAAMRRSEESLIHAIEELNTGRRGLRAFAAMTDRGPTSPVRGTRLLDPLKPFEPLWFLKRRTRKR
jgi:phosphatidylserine/phosphatidylglycerophosphate/cardiolipin synthase-like enzyme